jgi:hypothetical protein
MDVELSQGTLVLDMPTCTGGLLVERVLSMAPAPVVMPAQELAALLTPYGRSLVLGQGAASPPTHPIGQVLHGHVGSASVTLYLGDSPGAEVDGAYFDDHIRTPIAVYGELHGTALVLHEGEGKDFTLKIDGNRLIGTWHGGGKTLPVALE